MLNPRENLKLVGHSQAKEIFLNAYHSDRFPHAWILAGPFGIGKATFAFYMTRFLLSGDDNILANHPIYRQIVADSHGDVRVIGSDDVREIGIETIRDLNGFLNQTSAQGGFRVVIIDGADKLNRNAANALLKRLEEPPPKTVFFLTTSVPGRLLPTIRSRCQVLNLLPLTDGEVEEVIKDQNLTAPEGITYEKGSPGRLIRLMEGEGGQIYADLQKVLAGGSPSAFIKAYGSDEAAYGIVEDLIRNFIHMNILEKVESDTLDQTLKVCEKVETLLDECQFAQLDRKATLTCVLETLTQRH
jgi:DNA polymerase-3 subunit delta'